MEGGAERRDLLEKVIGQLLAGDDGKAGNVIDRLLGIKFGALPAGFRKNVDEMRADIEEPQFEHGEQAHRPRADNQAIGLDRFIGHQKNSGRAGATPAGSGFAASWRKAPAEGKNIPRRAAQNLTFLNPPIPPAAAQPSPSARDDL